MEAGAHSPWISRFLEALGWRVVVSNPRKVRAIYQHERKSDQRDALMLARIGRMDLALLYPVRHGTAEGQQDLLRIKLRDSLVRARVAVINSVRFTLKSLGYTVRNSSSARFHKVVMEEVPESVREMITPSVQALAELTARIKMLELEINTLAQMKYPQSAQLQQIPGVGPITALYFVLKIEDPNRFAHVRDVGAYAGLCPRRDQSGESDPQLRISKRGDAYLRRLLVSAAHYILGPFGPQSALRALAKTLQREAHRIDHRHSSSHQAVAQLDAQEILLPLRRAVTNRIKQSQVHSPNTRQHQRITLVTLALMLINRSHLARIGHHYPPAKCFQKSTDPRTMRSRLHHPERTVITTGQLL